MNEAEELIAIVEGIDGAMKHGTWRDEKGMRLKDTKEWVAFYNSVRFTPSKAQRDWTDE